jgi:hypothetical protein
LSIVYVDSYEARVVIWGGKGGKVVVADCIAVGGVGGAGDGAGGEVIYAGDVEEI